MTKALEKQSAQSTQGLTPSFATVVAAGFSVQRTVRVGDPTEPGRVKAYAGRLISPGAPATMAPDEHGEVKELPTWTANPLNEKLEPMTEFVDTLICPHDLHTFLSGAWKIVQENPGLHADFLVEWTEKTKHPTDGRKMLNRYNKALRLTGRKA